MRFPSHVCVILISATLACGDVAVTSTDESPETTSADPIIAGTLRIVATPELGGVVELDSVFATILGPDSRILVLSDTDSSYEGQADALTPGTYSVASAGFADDEIVLLAHAVDQMVSDRDTTNVTLSLVSFVPAIKPLHGDSPSVFTSVDLDYGSVPYANGYLVETDTTASFVTASAVAADTSATVLLDRPGSYFFRVRAQNDLVGAGAPSEITSIQVATDLTQSGDDASSAPVLDVESSEFAPLDGLNILPAGDEDWFAVDLSAGEKMDVIVRSFSMIPGSTLTPSLELLGDADISLAEGINSDNPASDVWQRKTAMEDGRYFIRVTGADGLSVGHYELYVSIERSDSAMVQEDLIEETYSSPFSGFLNRHRSTIDNSDEWQTFWQQLWGSIAPLPATPEIDFDEKMVIVAAMGQQTTGGHSIEIEKVIESDGTIVASVVETSPGTGCLVIQALTAPATAVIVPRSDSEVTFEERAATRDCS